ncbi:MAG: transglutaminase domain-containing protein [Oscillospiraceae bacterium]
MDNIKFFSRENAVKKALPFVFTFLICSAICYLYLKSYLNIYSLLSAGLTIIFFAAFDFISRHKKLGFFVYFGMMVTLLAVINVVMSFAPNRIEFIEWFLTGAATIETNAAYMLSLILFFSFFISSAVYYFTHIIYRIAILTLIGIIPCAIFIKASQSVPAVYAISIAAVDVLLYLYHYKTANTKDKPSFGKAAAITGYIDFAVAAVLIAVIIPKPQETPYYEKFEAFTSYFSFSGSYGAIDGSYTEHSGNADLYNEMESRQLYVVNSNSPEYYKIQVFDSYDSENRWWYSKTADPKRMCRYSWEESAPNRSFQKLAKAYLEYEEAGGTLLPESIDKTVLERFSTEEDSVYTAYIKSIDYPSIYLLAPERTIAASLYERSADYGRTRRTDLGEVMTDTGIGNTFIRANESYSVSFYGKDSAYKSGFIHSGLCDMSADDFYWLLVDMRYNFDLSSEAIDTADAYLREVFNELFDLPTSYEGFEDYYISEEMRELSAEITEGLTYDYEKAEAIEAFFNDGSFTYDLAYKAPEENDTPEYFVNESRRGTCSDFATAYCLLAKAAGLQVHYVEGFNQGELITSGVYNINTENAHAYPEVYIPGAGWIIYEPTVGGGSASAGNGNNNGNRETDYLAISVTCAVVVMLAALLLILILLMPAINERIFYIRVRHSSGSKAVILIYNRLSDKFAARFKLKTSTFTPKQLSELIKEKTDSAAEKIIAPFENACYGLCEISKNEANAALEEYKTLMKTVKKKKVPKN